MPESQNGAQLPHRRISVDISRELSLEKLVKPSLRCVVLVLIIVLSTGPLIRQLIAVSLLEFAALIVGLLWFLGDLIPCLALLLLLHDAILARRHLRITAPLLNGRNEDQLSLLDAICFILVLLYALDFVLFLTLERSRLDTYRFVFFHVQIWLAMGYIFTKAGQYDLKEVTLGFEKFYALALKMTRALISRLDYVPRAPKLSTTGGASVVEKEKVVEEESTRLSIVQDAPSRKSVKRDPVVELLSASSDSSKKEETSKTKRKKPRSTTTRRTRQVRRPAATSAIRITTGRRRGQGAKRPAVRRGRSNSVSVKQSIVSLTNVKSSRSNRRHECEPARTVNLNFNVN